MKFRKVQFGRLALALCLCVSVVSFSPFAFADEGAATKVRFGAALPSGASQWSIFTLTDGSGLYQCQHSPTCTNSGQWVAVGAGGGGGGANVALSNLSGVAINAALVPGQGSSLAIRGFNDDNTHPATNVTITGGAAGTSGNPGNVTITGGTGSATSVAGGVVNIAGGPAGGGLPGGVNVSTPLTAPIVLSVGTKAYTSTSSDITLETQDLAGTGSSSIYLLAGGASITTPFLPTIEIMAGHAGVPGAIYLNAAVSGGANSGQIWMANSNFDYLVDNVTDFDLPTGRPRDAYFGRNVYAGGAFIAGGGAVQTQLIGPYSGTAASSSGSGTLALTAGGAVQASFNGGAPQTLANVTSSISGQAGTALALAATPTQCSSSFATGIAANGNANCSTSDLITMNELTSRPTSLSGVGSLWFDATTHALRYNQNGGGDVQVGAYPNVQNSDLTGAQPANTLEIINGTNFEALRIYAGTDGTSANYSRLQLYYDSASSGDFVISSDNAGGTYSVHNLGFAVGSAVRWEVGSSYQFRPALQSGSQNVLDLGDSTHKIRNLYLGTELFLNSTTVGFTGIKSAISGTLMASGTVAGSSAALCTDASGNLTITTVSCPGGSGTVTSVATTSPITGGTFTTTGTIGCATCLINNGVNTLTAAGTLDASASTVSNAVKVPVVAGATATANGALAYDSTNNNLHVANASADAIAPVVTVTPTTGNCVSWSVVSSKIKLGDSGGPCGSSTGGGIVGYSAASLTLTANTYYFPVVGGGTPSTTETTVDSEAPSSATITNFFASVSTALGVGNTAVFTWRNNTADTSITCTITGASQTSCNDTTHSFGTVAGDLLTIKVVTTGTIVVTPTLVMTAQFGTTGSNGTVNSATINQIAAYGATGTAVSGLANATYTGSGSGLARVEGTAPSGVASSDLIYADSTAHRLKMNNNNGGADTVLGAATTDTLTNKSIAASEVNSGTLAIAQGGTNAATAGAALISLFPTASEVGDLVYCSTYSAGCTAWTLLAGNTSGTKMLQETSAGAPSWVTTPTTATLVSGNYVSASGAQGVQDSTVTAGPYAAPLILGNPYSSSTAITITATSNKMRIWGFVVPFPITTTQITYEIGTIDNTAATYDIGVLDTSCVLKTHTGSTAGTTFANATGQKTLSWTGGSATLQPGKYYIALTSSCTASCAAFGGTAATQVSFYNAVSDVSVSAGGTLNGGCSIPADVTTRGATLPSLMIR